MTPALIRDNRGSAYVMTAFLILLVCSLALVVYSVAITYNKYIQAQNDLERVLSVSVDEQLRNDHIRDLLVDVPNTVPQAVENNLKACGWSPDGTDWVKTLDGTERYRLSDLQIALSGNDLMVRAKVSFPSPWSFGGIHHITIPLKTQVQVLYIE